MIAVPSHSPKLTPVEYFAWEEQQLCRHEYINGEVYAMGGGTQNHSRIALKVAALLDNHLSNGSCRVFNSDCRVNLVGTNDYVLVSSQEIVIDLYRKNSDERWEIINYRTGDIVKWQSVDLSFPIEQVYRGIDLSEVAVESTTTEKS
jgi:Uma2 family endonuclease